jgi:pSer/pThr/pTyr-binding forkhead associated (FHA) protein
MTSPITDAPGKLVLSLPDGLKQEFTLSKRTITIGRGTTSDIVIRDPVASRNHAHVLCTGSSCEVVDLGSANGIRVNGQSVARAVLSSGDVLLVGNTSFRFEPAGPEPDPEITRVEPDRQLEDTLVQTPLSVQLEETSLARLAIHTPDRTWEVAITGDSLTIGRHPNSDVVVNSAQVSRNHAVLEQKGDAFTIRDLQSANGTWLKGNRIARVALDDGDTLQIGPARIVFKRAFSADDLTVLESPRDGVAAKRRPVVVVPGFAGSNLWRGSEQIWPVPRKLLTQSHLLRRDEPLEARGLVNEVVIIPNLIKQDQYSLLVDYLKENLGYESGNDLLEFGYDFRQDNRLSARRLGAAIEEWGVRHPITIIAHSMGCLVSRYYLECLGGKKRVERAIFLGGPHAGTPYAFASLLRGPGLLPLGFLNAQLRDVLATYPSWYQILPTYQFAADQKSQALEVLSEESWLSAEQRPLLRDAVAFRKELGTQSSVPAVCIFGYGLKTITGVTVEREESGVCQKATFGVTTTGDGTIPEASAVLERAEIHPVRQHHGSLYVDNDVKMRLKLELTRPAAPGP